MTHQADLAAAGASITAAPRQQHAQWAAAGWDIDQVAEALRVTPGQVWGMLNPDDGDQEPLPEPDNGRDRWQQSTIIGWARINRWPTQHATIPTETRLHHTLLDGLLGLGLAVVMAGHTVTAHLDANGWNMSRTLPETVDEIRMQARATASGGWWDRSTGNGAALLGAAWPAKTPRRVWGDRCALLLELGPDQSRIPAMVRGIGDPAVVLDPATTLPRSGQTRWNLAPANRGMELVRDRLAPLTHAVAGLTAGEVREQLTDPAAGDRGGNVGWLPQMGQANQVRTWVALQGLAALPTRAGLLPLSTANPVQWTAAGVSAITRAGYRLTLPIPLEPTPVVDWLATAGTDQAIWAADELDTGETGTDRAVHGPVSAALARRGYGTARWCVVNVAKGPNNVREAGVGRILTAISHLPQQ